MDCVRAPEVFTAMAGWVDEALHKPMLYYHCIKLMLLVTYDIASKSIGCCGVLQSHCKMRGEPVL